MKRLTTKILIALMATLPLVSCLDEHPRDQVDENEIYNSATGIYVNAVATLYNYIGGSEESEGLQGTCRGIYDYNTLTTDEAIIPIRGGDWYDGGYWNALFQHKWSPEDEPLYNTWKYLFRTIVLCNNSLDVIQKHADILTDYQLQDFRSEVRAVRALFYYYAMDMFGRIPLVVSETEQQANPQLQKAQAERSEVFHFVYNELLSVVPCLTEERSNNEGNYYGRMTAPVAYFLLAKLALNAEIYTYDDWTKGYDYRPDGKLIYLYTDDGSRLNAWETCIYYCERLKEAGYKLETDYGFNFSVHNETSAENIFTIPMDKNFYSAQFHYLFRSLHYVHASALGRGGENGTCATRSTMWAYHYGQEDQDNRCSYNFEAGPITVDGKDVMLDNGEVLAYLPFTVEQNLTNSPYIKTAGARMKKYETDRNAYMDGKLQGNDIVLFRYADALLMEAEAKARNGQSGAEEMNAVRSRVHMPEREATLDNILEERLLELVWEGWRRQDLVRFGKFTDAYDMRESLPGEESGYTTVFPIPHKCIYLNPALEQNKGYE